MMKNIFFSLVFLVSSLYLVSSATAQSRNEIFVPDDPTQFRQFIEEGSVNNGQSLDCKYFGALKRPYEVGVQITDSNDFQAAIFQPDRFPTILIRLPEGLLMLEYYEGMTMFYSDGRIKNRERLQQPPKDNAVYSGEWQLREMFNPSTEEYTLAAVVLKDYKCGALTTIDSVQNLNRRSGIWVTCTGK